VTAFELPLVTLIVTTYNHERYIEQALTSVVEQKTSFPFEVVVIEDCSTDRTREIVQAFAARHPQKARLALAPANGNYNRLFAEEWTSCTSEYVATLDGDDYWTSPEKLQRQVEIMESRPEYSFCFHDVDVVSEGMSYVWEGRFTEGFGDGVRLRTLAWLDRAPGRAPGAKPGQKRTIDTGALWAGCFVPGCSPLLRRRFLPELPRGFGEIVFSDWALYLLIGQHGPIMYLDEVLGAYRVHGAGMWSGVSREGQHQQVARFFERMLDFLPANEHVIRSQIERHRSLAEAERRRVLRHRCLEQGLASARDADALESGLAGHVPPGSALIWTEPALRPVGLNHELLFFPTSAPHSWNVFGVGPQGQRSAPWIAPGYAYEFRLQRQDGPELGALTVIADRAAPGPTVVADPAEGRDQPEGVFLIAAPNPAKAQGTHAGTEISWSTGNGSAGTVLVASYPLEEGLPADDADAVATLERLRARGGEFMLIAPVCAWWLEAYPGLDKHLSAYYRLLLDDQLVGKLYDLRR
jgi:hypothetical protein